MDDDTPAGAAESDQRRLRTSRRLAIGAFLLAVTALLLPWWRLTWSTAGTAIRDDVRVFRPEEPLTTVWGPWLTGALVVAALGLLFMRIAGRSDLHEPPSWRRDVGIAAGLVGGALVSCLLWPADVPSFWGGRTYTAENVTTEVTEVAMPGLGWWIGLAAAALLAAARVLCPPPTTQK